MRAFKLLLSTGAVGLVMAGIVIGTAGLSTPSPEASDRSSEGAVGALMARQQQAADDYAKLPVSFVENKGQTDARVRYFAQGNGYSFFMTPSEVMLSFAKDSTGKQTPHGLALALRFVGGNPNVEPQGSERAPGVINDLRGVDPSMWHTDIAQYREVVYPELWPKIDMRLHEQSGALKYEFHVHPGASPSDIQLAYGGADGLALGETGGAADRDPARHVGGFGAGVVPRHRRGPRSGGEQLRVGRRRERERSILVRRSAATNAIANWSSTPACSTRPSSAATVPRPPSASLSTRPATPTSRARHSRPTSRPRPEPSIAPVRRRTSPTCS